MVTDQERIRALPWCLVHGVLNSIFAIWTFGSSLFVLFLGELGLPKGQIGSLLSLFPFCGLLALGFAPVAARWGRKRVFLLGYGIRKPVMAMLLLLPWIVSTAGRTTAVVFLSVVIAVFAVLRALAETAYYPWSQEFIPNHVRGKFAAWSAVLGLLASALALTVAGHVVANGTGLGRYMLLIGVGCAVGIVGVLVMIRIPGGEPMRDGAGLGTHFQGMRTALADRNFTSYLGGLAGLTVGTALMVAFLPLYLREECGLPAATVVRLDLMLMVGGGIASLGCGWLSDRVGSRPVLMPSVGLLVLLPVGWLLLPRHSAYLVVFGAALYFLYGMASNGVAIGAGRLLFNGVIPPGSNTAYTAVYYAWMGLTGGLAPLLAGGVLTLTSGKSLHVVGVELNGYAVLFLLSLPCLLLGWYLYGRVRADDRFSTRMVLRNFMNRITQR